MTAVKKLQECQQKNNSLICLGLDLDVKKMPSDFVSSSKGMFDFATKIIEATADKVCAYKPNMAFYESLGSEGWSLLRMLRSRIPEEIPVILDGKRGDIGNTAAHYAQSLYEDFNADWVTLNPYMGYDSMRPFLEYEDKGVFILCLTSNSGSKDFQQLIVDGKPLYQVVAEKVDYWNKENNCGLVVGATHPDQLKELRTIAKDMPLLIPGVGAQGGSLETAAINGTDNFKKLALINVSRSVLYASIGSDFDEKASEELEKLNAQVTAIRENKTEMPDSNIPETASEVQASEREKVELNTEKIQTDHENKPETASNNYNQQQNQTQNTSHDTRSNITPATENLNNHNYNNQNRDYDNRSQHQNSNQEQYRDNRQRDNQHSSSNQRDRTDQRSYNDRNNRHHRNDRNRYGNRNRNNRNFNRDKDNNQNQRFNDQKRHDNASENVKPSDSNSD